MIYFILRKLVFLIPTVLVVIITAFFLSKLIPGDQADSMLILQGVQPEASNYKKEYHKIYKKQGLDKPLFYFSVLPHFYPKNIHSIIDEQERELCKKWIEGKYESDKIELVLQKRKLLIDRLGKDTIDLIINYQKALSFEKDMNQISLWCDTITQNTLSYKEDATILKAALSSMEASKVSWYYPSVTWHGTENQFNSWIKDIVKGDLGLSIKDGRLVKEKIIKAIRWTILLAILSLIIALAISIPVGLYNGYYANTKIANLSSFFWLMLYSIPVFWLASILILYCTSDRYGSWLHIFPAPGLWYIPEGQSMWSTLVQYSQQLILPLICMVANDIAQISSIVRNNTEEQKSKLYVLMARAKGMTDKDILLQHILPNVLLPLITIAGGRLASGISGALIIEVIFNIPGMGRLMYDSILASDWNVVFGILIVLSFFTIVFLTITEILYAWANPKVHQKMQVS